MSLSTIERAELLRKLLYLKERLKKIEKSLTGQSLSMLKIADLAITNAKIQSLIANKILAGDLVVKLLIGKPKNGEIVFDAENTRMTMSDSSSKVRLLIGNYNGQFTVRISIPGVDVFESDDPRDFSLIADEDNILIKEFSRGSSNVNNSSTLEVSHNLGYFPHFYTYGEISAGRYQLVAGYNLYGDWRSYVDTAKLYLQNISGSAGEGRYYLFYDDIPD